MDIRGFQAFSYVAPEAFPEPHPYAFPEPEPEAFPLALAEPEPSPIFRFLKNSGGGGGGSQVKPASTTKVSSYFKFFCIYSESLMGLCSL